MSSSSSPIDWKRGGGERAAEAYDHHPFGRDKLERWLRKGFVRPA